MGAGVKGLWIIGARVKCYPLLVGGGLRWSGNDPRNFNGGPSIRETLWRQYNNALDTDAPIDPTLETLLFGYGEEDEPSYYLPLLKHVERQGKHKHAERREAAADVCFPRSITWGSQNTSMKPAPPESAWVVTMVVSKAASPASGTS